MGQQIWEELDDYYLVRRVEEVRKWLTDLGVPFGTHWEKDLTSRRSLAGSRTVSAASFRIDGGPIQRIVCSGDEGFVDHDQVAFVPLLFLIVPDDRLTPAFPTLVLESHRIWGSRVTRWKGNDSGLPLKDRLRQSPEVQEALLESDAVLRLRCAAGAWVIIAPHRIWTSKKGEYAGLSASLWAAYQAIAEIVLACPLDDMAQPPPRSWQFWR